ncbi:uncharacterized protein TM35_000071070 [Trypanosoma theileri]|uniref:Uncharacterized protein n=1 Tax=Trypanosoma theileri TaxID=67003 RepID=A0A1X0P1U6_9TRYP|nr:uncharacterized protein TM35_000071070 [Trypanosoma theileri]ORC90683.1 hypothetical protein TM35_000071070 [Trypanosoma theileri]
MNQSQSAVSYVKEEGVREDRITTDEAQEINVESEAQQGASDSNQFQNYYYEAADGNYYYYPGEEAPINEEVQEVGEIPLTPENLIRSYEFEDWEPRSYNWFADIVLDIFMSFGFRIYFAFLLYCTGALLVSIFLNWTFQVLFRMYTSTGDKNTSIGLVMGFFSIFFFLSFTIVTAFCTWSDMIKDLWRVKRDDIKFWGMSSYRKNKPPYYVYFILIIATAIFPFIWGIIDAAYNKQSLIFFAQSFAFISVIVTACIVAICYIWFYWLALKQKRVTFTERLKRDDYLLWENASKHKVTGELKKRWYHASTVLEEYGLDGKTLRWNSVVFTLGCVPLFGLYTSQALSTFIGDPEVTWGAIASVSITCVFVVSWMSMFHTRSHWSLYASIFLIFVLLVLGIVGCAIAASKEAVAVVIVLFFASHCMLARKRRHELTIREQCKLFKISLDPEIRHDVQKRKYDTYLLCCRDLFLSCIKCFDVKTFFGYRHPDVVRAERKYELDNITLRTDQKVLLYWWLIVMFALAFVIALGNAMVYRFTNNIAVRGSPIIGEDSGLSFCQIRYNVNGSAPLGLYDLSLLSALSYTLTTNGDVDFVTWFNQFPNFVRQFPLRLPPDFDYATDGINIQFSDFVDLTSDYHFITLNANNRGLSLMRSIDDWGTSIAVQIAGIISPLVSIWPENYRTSFVKGASFFRTWFPHSDVLHSVSVYIDNLIAVGKKERILLVGDEFNGGYVKILASKYNLPFVAFNPPGTKYILSVQLKGLQVSFTRGLLSYIDSLEDTLETIYLQCDGSYSSNRCSRIQTTIETIAKLCGDPQGRYLK